MTVPNTEAEADLLAGRGDIAGAERILEQVVATGGTHVDTWLKLGALRRARGNIDGAMEAVGQALALDPLHFMALMSRARLLELTGQGQEAARFYVRAMAQLPEGETPPPHLRGMVEHAARVSDAYRETVTADWAALLGDVDGLTTDERRRADRFTTNALRRTRVYHSEPTHYHYPGLIEREFHDRAAFPWLATLEAATDIIRDDFLALQADQQGRSEPYIQYSADLPVRQWAALNHSMDWTALHLLRSGTAVPENAERCPRTMALLAAIEQPHIDRRSPNAMFSVLKPRTRIPPHTGVANTRLVCHVPLIVPDGCWFRVGAETRTWQPGTAFVFDDTIEHEAANDSDHPRVVLILDLWHPGLSPAERTAVTRLMQADGSAEGTPL